MKFFILIIVLFLGFTQYIIAQNSTICNDSTYINFNLGLRGMLQTGNTSRISIQPNITYSHSNNNLYFGIKTQYDYMNINGRNVNNDFWGDILF